MIDIKNIAKGFINNTKAEFGIADPKIESEAERRYLICLQCPIISNNKLRCDKDKGGCNCKLAWKIRSDSKCPKSKW